MSKQSNQKLKLLYLLKILLEQTDEQSSLTLKQLSTELAKYNVSAARKSLYDDIEALRLFGFDVSVKRDRYVKYYVAKREISFVELKYIVDALEGFDAIDRSVAHELAQKIIKFGGVRGRAYTDIPEPPVPKIPKAISDTLYKNIDILSAAISARKKICCKEFYWNSSKQRILKNDGKILTLTPIRLFCDNKYLLYAFDGTAVYLYSVDRLLNIELLDENGAQEIEYISLLEGEQSASDYENVRLECNASFAGDVFDKFGLAVTVLSNKLECFEISVKVKLDDRFFSWVFENARNVRIISPERVREEQRKRLILALNDLDCKC